MSKKELLTKLAEVRQMTFAYLDVQGEGSVAITHQEYARQMSRPNTYWTVRSGNEAFFDDEKSESSMQAWYEAAGAVRKLVAEYEAVHRPLPKSLKAL